MADVVLGADIGGELNKQVQQKKLQDTQMPLPLTNAIPDVVNSDLPQQKQEDKLNFDANKDPYFATQWDTMKRSWNSGGNFAAEVFRRIEREADAGPADPNFDPKAFIAKNKAMIPEGYEGSLMYSSNEREATDTLRVMHQQLNDQAVIARRTGVSPFVAQALVGIVDLDTPLMFLSGGGEKAIGIGARAARMASGAAQGALTQGFGQAAAAAASPVGDWAAVPTAAFLGGGLGMLAHSGAGRTVEHDFNETLHDTHSKFDEYVADGAPLKEGATADTPNKPAFFNEEHSMVDQGVDPAMQIPGNDRGSIGARQLNATGSLANVTNETSQKLIAEATKAEQADGAIAQWYDGFADLRRKGALGDTAAKWATYFHDSIRASPLVTEADKWMKSGSVVAQRFMMENGEFANGMYVNANSTARIMARYRNELSSIGIKPMQDSYMKWANEKGIGQIERHVFNDYREQFNRDVIHELNHRMYDDPALPSNATPAVREAADVVDRFYKREAEIGKGRTGEVALKGFEDIDHKPGYHPQVLHGQKTVQAVRKFGLPAVHDFMAHAIQETNKWMPIEDAEFIARAIVRRALELGRDVDTNLVGILQQDGREHLREMLNGNGLTPADVDKLIDTLQGASNERGQLGQTKNRTNIDMRVQRNGLSAMDIYNTDVMDIMARRTRTTSGYSALARKGFNERSKLDDTKRAILDEQIARGPSQSTGSKVEDILHSDKHITAEDFDNFIGQFVGKGAGHGVWVSNVMKTTFLALMNQLGITNVAEMGATAGYVGVNEWAKHTKAAGADMLKNAYNPTSELYDELRRHNIILDEELLHRSDLAVDMELEGNPQGTLGLKINKYLSKASFYQGYWNAAYHVRRLMQRTMVTSVADKWMRNMAGMVDSMSPERWYDTGLEQGSKYYNDIKKYVDNGTVEFKDGTLHKLNLDKWDWQDRDIFTQSIHAMADRLIQKAQIGERIPMFHANGIAALVMQLKAFPMLAVEKQFIRGLKHGDATFAAEAMYGLAFAATAYTAKNALNMRGENLDPIKIAKGAIGTANITGWVPMWTDPLMSVIGADSLKFNNYSQGIDGNVISTPAAFPTLNHIANVPGSMLSILTGNKSDNDIRALQSGTVLGQMYIVNGALNLMKQGRQKTKAEQAALTESRFGIVGKEVSNAVSN